MKTGYLTSQEQGRRSREGEAGLLSLFNERDLLEIEKLQLQIKPVSLSILAVDFCGITN